LFQITDRKQKQNGGHQKKITNNNIQTTNTTLTEWLNKFGKLKGKHLLGNRKR